MGQEFKFSFVKLLFDMVSLNSWLVRLTCSLNSSVVCRSVLKTGNVWSATQRCINYLIMLYVLPLSKEINIIKANLMVTCLILSANNMNWMQALAGLLKCDIYINVRITIPFLFLLAVHSLSSFLALVTWNARIMNLMIFICLKMIRNRVLLQWGLQIQDWGCSGQLWNAALLKMKIL